MVENKPLEKMSQRERIQDIFFTFLKFGCFTFGGGWSIVAQIQKDYVENKKWITDEELLDYTSVGRSLPGMMVGNASALFGYHVAGIPGAIAAVIGICAPAMVIMFLVTFIYQMVSANIYVARAMMGVRAAVVPIIICALLKLFKSAMKDWPCYAIAAAAFSLCLFTNISNVLVVVLGAVAGYAVMEVKNRRGIH